MTSGIQVYKFGGASVKDAEGIKRVGKIIQDHDANNLVVIVSAIGKMTNALEKIVKAHAAGKEGKNELLDTIRNDHYEICNQLFDKGDAIYAELNDTFVEIEWIIEDEPHEDFDFMYDQIVSVGELASSRILAAYLNKIGLQTKWLDARGLIRTNNLYREAVVDWAVTTKQIKDQTTAAFEQNNIVVAQGFIGSTSENYTTTLGREGSDFTASIFSYCLEASSMSIWKDVPGVLTADPRYFDNVQKLERLSYREAIEMTYYGAKVIHQKTIKPLQNKSIPLYVKSFIRPEGEGTFISSDVEDQYPPIIVIEREQALLNISTRDFSFVAEHHLSYIFQQIANFRLHVHLMQNTAISFNICVNDIDNRIEEFSKAIEKEFNVTVERDLELVTIRHYLKPTVKALQENRLILLEERVGRNMRMVTKIVSPVVRKSE